MIKWFQQTKNFGLDYPSFLGEFKDFRFDIRYDYDGDSTVKPNCGSSMQILFMEKEIRHILGSEKQLIDYANKFIENFLKKYTPSVK